MSATEEPVFPDTPPPRSSLGRVLREPLLHFTLIGAMIFVISLWGGRSTAKPDDRRIVLTEDDLSQLVITWRAQGYPPPDSGQFQRLLETRIREEVLYREAVAMGLDQDDTIVRRRMAQKMDFLAEDLSALQNPTEAELETWMKSRSQEFALPPQMSFRHLYFPFDRYHDKAREAAESALAKAADLAADSPAALALGDPFMFKDRYVDRTPDQLAKEFGGKFSKEIFGQIPGVWAGPVESGFGWHLVFIDSLTPGSIPEFDEVKAEVRTLWEAEQRAEFKKEAYRVMREKYQVILPDDAPGKAKANES